MSAPPLSTLWQESLAQLRAGRLAEAEAGLRRLLAARPGHAGVLHALGTVARQQRRPAEAAELIGQAIAAARGDATAGMHNDLALALVDQGRAEAALAHYARALALHPGYAEAHANRATALAALRRREEAVADYAAAVEGGLDDAAVHQPHGVLLAALNRHVEALAAVDRALACDPMRQDVYIVRGAVLLALARFAEALANYDRLIALNPAMALAHSGRGGALQGLRRPEEAIESHDRAVTLAPDVADLHVDRGITLAALGRRVEALATFHRAVELRPESAAALVNLARELTAHGDLDAALPLLERALVLDPAMPEAQLNRALLDLLQGRLAEGLKRFELRWRARDFTSPRRGFAQPQWHGEALAGRTLLLHAEQGLGDTIQFARYVPMAAARAAAEGGRVMFECPAALLPLFAGRVDGVQVIGPGGGLPAFDLHCPLMSLPLAFGTELATIPAPVPYLRAEPDRAAAWRARLAAKPGPRVGLVWSGNPRHGADRDRSIPLAALLPLVECGATLFGLQPEVRPADRATLAANPRIVDLGPSLAHFGETAAAMAGLDLVISVDTAAAHLAAALGRPTWVLVHFVPDWRWLLDREDSPWYPTARLFRQPAMGDWATPLGRVAEALRAFVTEFGRDARVKPARDGLASDSLG